MISPVSLYCHSMYDFYWKMVPYVSGNVRAALPNITAHSRLRRSPNILCGGGTGAEDPREGLTSEARLLRTGPPL